MFNGQPRAQSLDLPPEKEVTVPTDREAGWAPESVWILWRREKSLFFLPKMESVVAGRRTKCTIPMCILYNQRDATYTMFFIIISALHVSGGFSAHHQELIKLYAQPWVLSCFPAQPCVLSCFPAVYPNTPAVGSRKASQYPRLHIQFYKLLMMGGKIARNMYSADNNKERCISRISLVI